MYRYNQTIFNFKVKQICLNRFSTTGGCKYKIYTLYIHLCIMYIPYKYSMQCIVYTYNV